MALIREWMLLPLDRQEAALARHILRSLNWGVCAETGTLFVGGEVHRATALLLVEAREAVRIHVRGEQAREDAAARASVAGR